MSCYLLTQEQTCPRDLLGRSREQIYQFPSHDNKLLFNGNEMEDNQHKILEAFHLHSQNTHDITEISPV